MSRGERTQTPCEHCGVERRTVSYFTPVYVTVEPAGRGLVVTRVRVNDEYTANDDEHTFNCPGCDRGLSKALSEETLGALSNGIGWPSWEFIG